MKRDSGNIHQGPIMNMNDQNRSCHGFAQRSRDKL